MSQSLRSKSKPDVPNVLTTDISVIDTGEGMAPDVLARVAEPFFTTKERGKGTGLGLAMAKGFAEQSGGGISLTSGPGAGTKVTLWFPTAAGEDNAVTDGNTAPAATSAPGRRCHVLLVEDDAIVRQVTTEVLQSEGFTVLPVGSGSAALSVIDSGESFEVLLTDLSMPGMDGLTVIHEAQRRRAGLPAVLLTGFAPETSDLAAVEEMGARLTLLRKPVTARQLSETIIAVAANTPG